MHTTCAADQLVLPPAVGMPRSFKPAAIARNDAAPVAFSSAMAAFATAIAVLAARPASRTSGVSLARARKPPSLTPRHFAAAGAQEMGVAAQAIDLRDGQLGTVNAAGLECVGQDPPTSKVKACASGHAD